MVCTAVGTGTARSVVSVLDALVHTHWGWHFHEDAFRRDAQWHQHLHVGVALIRACRPACILILDGGVPHGTCSVGRGALLEGRDTELEAFRVVAPLHQRFAVPRSARLVPVWMRRRWWRLHQEGRWRRPGGDAVAALLATSDDAVPLEPGDRTVDGACPSASLPPSPPAPVRAVAPPPVLAPGRFATYDPGVATWGTRSATAAPLPCTCMRLR